MTPVEILLIALVALWFAVIIWLEVSSRNRGESGEGKGEAECGKGIEPIASAAQEPVEEGGAEARAKAPENVEVPDILCQFVFSGKGEKVGETIAIDGDLVIIKAKEKYYAVPLKHVENKDGRLTVMGVADWSMAEQLAEKWKEKSKKLNS